VIFAAQIVVILIAGLGCLIFYDAWKEKQGDRIAKKLNLTPTGGYPPWIVTADPNSDDWNQMMRRLAYDVSTGLSQVMHDNKQIIRLLQAGDALQRGGDGRHDTNDNGRGVAEKAAHQPV
jgi:hypothetical protein